MCVRVCTGQGLRRHRGNGRQRDADVTGGLPRDSAWGTAGLGSPPVYPLQAERRWSRHAPGRGGLQLGRGRRPPAPPAPCNSWEAPHSTQTCTPATAARVWRAGTAGTDPHGPPCLALCQRRSQHFAHSDTGFHVLLRPPAARLFLPVPRDLLPGAELFCLFSGHRRQWARGPSADREERPLPAQGRGGGRVTRCAVRPGPSVCAWTAWHTHAALPARRVSDALPSSCSVCR